MADGVDRRTVIGAAGGAMIVPAAARAQPPASGAAAVMLTPQMFGARGDGKTDDASAFADLVAFARAHSRRITIPCATYRFLAPLEIRAIHDGYPWHSLDLIGEQMDGVVLLFDYDGAHAVRVNDATGSYSGMAGARIGNFTVTVAPGRRVEQPFRVLNALNCQFENIRVRADWHRLDDRVELFRVSAATQWSRFENIVVEPYDVPYPSRVEHMRGTGISIGNPYRDVPLQSSAISNNSFHDCTVVWCRIGFLSEASDATSTYNCRVIASRFNWVDRASYATLHVNPWDEGALERGFTFEAARITDSLGTSLRKTQFPQIVGGYVGAVKIDGVIGGAFRCSMTALEITANVQCSRVTLIGQEGAIVTGDANDCLVERYDSNRGAYTRTLGVRPHIARWGDTGSELHLDEAPNPGFSIYKATGAAGFAGLREEIDADGIHRSYAWRGGAIGKEARTLVRRASADAHWFATPLLPEADARYTLGDATRRWRTIHLASSPVVTSDAAAKTDPQAIPDDWLDAWATVCWSRFRYRDAVAAAGDAAPWHAGLVAQQIVAAFADAGLDADAIGLIVRDHDAPLGVRYDECHAFEAAWQRREIGRLRDALARSRATA